MLHPGCAGLPAVPDGDWHCPHCVCACCGHARFGARTDLEAASGQVPIPNAPDLPKNSAKNGFYQSPGQVLISAFHALHSTAKPVKCRGQGQV